MLIHFSWFTQLYCNLSNILKQQVRDGDFRNLIIISLKYHLFIIYFCLTLLTCFMHNFEKRAPKPEMPRSPSAILEAVCHDLQQHTGPNLAPLLEIIDLWDKTNRNVYTCK